MSLEHYCQIKRGFFVLRGCGQLAPHICHVCSRAVCQEHARLAGTTLRCLECLASDQEATTEPETYDWQWVYYYRQAYEADGDATPPPTYDDNDVQAFEQPDREALQTDDDGDDSALES